MRLARSLALYAIAAREADPLQWWKLAYVLTGHLISLTSRRWIAPAAVFVGIWAKFLVCQLQSLEAKGVRLILCSTCLNYFDLADKISVGIVGGMTDIIEAQRQAGKVISP